MSFLNNAIGQINGEISTLPFNRFDRLLCFKYSNTATTLRKQKLFYYTLKTPSHYTILLHRVVTLHYFCFYKLNPVSSKYFRNESWINKLCSESIVTEMWRPKRWFNINNGSTRTSLACFSSFFIFNLIICFLSIH